MANALTAGTLQLVASAKISGAKINPQGTAVTISLASPTAGEDGAGQVTTAFGTGAGQCDILCAADYDLTVSGGLTPSVIIDLYANGLPNVFGGDANFRHLKAVLVAIVANGEAGVGATVGNAGSNPAQMWFGAAGQTWTIFPSSVPFVGAEVTTGYVIDATHRNLKIANASATAPVTVRVLLGGTST